MTSNAALAIAISIGCTHSTPPATRPAAHLDVMPGTYLATSEVHNGAAGFDRHEIQLALIADGTAHATRTSTSVYAAANEAEHDVDDHAVIEMSGTWTRDGGAIVVHLETDGSSRPDVHGWELRCRATTSELVCDFPPPAAAPLVLHRRQVSFL